MSIHDDRDTTADSARGGGEAAPAVAPTGPARFTCIYEGADQRLCMFEMHDGHLVAVRTARLA